MLKRSNPSQRLLKGMRGGGRPPPGLGAIGGGVGAFRVGAGRDGIKGGAPPGFLCCCENAEGTTGGGAMTRGCGCCCGGGCGGKPLLFHICGDGEGAGAVDVALGAAVKCPDGGRPPGGRPGREFGAEEDG